MSAASEPVMDAVEKVADWLIQQQYARYAEDRDGDGFHVVEVRIDDLASDLLAAFPQLALEGREEWGVDLGGGVVDKRVSYENAVHTERRTGRPLTFRTVWEGDWSEVQS